MPADLPNGFSQRSADWWLPDVAHDSEAPAMKRYRKFVDSLLEESGFELVVPPSFSQLATQAERRSRSARRESPSLLEGGPTARIRLPPAKSRRGVAIQTPVARTNQSARRK